MRRGRSKLTWEVCTKLCVPRSEESRWGFDRAQGDVGVEILRIRFRKCALTQMKSASCTIPRNYRAIESTAIVTREFVCVRLIAAASGRIA